MQHGTALPDTIGWANVGKKQAHILAMIAAQIQHIGELSRDCSRSGLTA